MAKASLPNSFSIDNLTFTEKPASTLFLDIEGLRFGRLVVVRFINITRKKSYWLCRCDCGNLTKSDTTAVRSGRSQSCGCRRNDLLRGRSKTHGQYKTAEYRTWAAMLYRCRNPKAPQYANYGGRGIKVCERWYQFGNFFEDMGERPSNRHSLERTNNDLGYTPDNCRWALPSEQSNNKRNNHLLTVFGKTQTVTQWAAERDIDRRLLLKRVNRGWDAEKAILTPRMSEFVRK